MRTILSGLTMLFAGVAVSAERPSPADEPRQVVAALKANDVARLILATHGDDVLEAFLSAGPGENAEEIARQIDRANASDPQIAQVLELLRKRDIAAASSILYPKWQSAAPQALAGMQGGLTMFGMDLANDKDRSVEERAQLTELAFAANAWLARTDFLDKQNFDALLVEASELMIAAKLHHPLEFQLKSATERADIAGQLLAALKRSAKRYGLDADAILDSVQVDSTLLTPDRATLSVSFTAFGVPVHFEEELVWSTAPVGMPFIKDGWVSPEMAQAYADMRAHAEPAEAEEAPTSLTDTGCSVPDSPSD
jgi:hypothetical protein